MTRDEVFQELEKRGATSAEVSFEGGNDEGSAENAVLFDGEAEIGELDEHDPQYERDEWGNIVFERITGSNYPHPKTTPLSPAHQADNDLAEALAAPVYDEFGNFGGSFDVEGKVVWDVRGRTVAMIGNESVWEPIEKEL